MHNEEILPRVKQMFAKYYPDLALSETAYESLTDKIAELVQEFTPELKSEEEQAYDLRQLKDEIEAEVRADMEEEENREFKNMGLDSPACKISFRQLQQQLAIAKDFKEYLEKNTPNDIRLVELKQLEFELTEKLLKNRYW